MTVLDAFKMSACKAFLSTLKDVSDLYFDDDAQKLNNLIALSWYLAGIWTPCSCHYNMASVTLFFLPSRRKPTYSPWSSVLYVHFPQGILGLRIPLGVMNAIKGYLSSCNHAMEIMLKWSFPSPIQGVFLCCESSLSKGMCYIIGRWGPQNLLAFKDPPGAKGVCHLWPDF